MSILDRFSLLGGIKVAAVAAFAFGASLSASQALTIQLIDNTTTSSTTFGLGDAGSTVGGIAVTSLSGTHDLFGVGSFGGFDVTVSTAIQSFFPPAAFLLADFSAGFGTGNVTMIATSSPMHVPLLPLLATATNQTLLPGPTKVAKRDVGSATTSALSEISFDDGDSWIELASLSSTSPDSEAEDSSMWLALEDSPFMLRHQLTISGERTGVSANASAATSAVPIPLPAAGWLLLGGLGALGAVARRRRKAAAA